MRKWRIKRFYRKALDRKGMLWTLPLLVVHLCMKALTILFLALLFYACTPPPLPADAKIIAKYRVLDEELSPIHEKCGEEVKDFLKMQEYECSFLLNEDEFDIERKWLVDKRGQVHEFWRYLAEGPLVYSHSDIMNDWGLKEDEVIAIGSQIRLSEDLQYVIDNEDSLWIERYFLTEQLIFTQRPEELKRDRRRLIFEYQTSR